MFGLLLSILVAAVPSFMHFGVSEGLSQTTVFSLCEDNEGKIWVGTYDGLNCFDSYDFTSYHHNPADSSSCPFNTVRLLYADKLGRIWVGSDPDSGLSYLNPETRRFVKLNDSSGVVIYCIGELSQDIIAIGTSSGLELYEVEDNGDVQKKDLVQLPFRPLCFLKDGDYVWFGSRGGDLVRYSADFSSYNTVFSLNGKGNGICKLIKSPESGKLFAATDGDGLLEFSEKDGSVNIYDTSCGLCSNYVRDLSLDSSGNIWIGTADGLSIFDPNDCSFINCYPDIFNRGALAHSSIKSILKDSSGGMWVGMYYYGVDYSKPYSSDFHFFPLVNPERKEMVLSGIREDWDGFVWIGTTREGLFKLQPSTGKLEKQAIFGTEERERTDLKAIEYSKDSSLVFLGTALGGLKIYNRKDNSLRQVSLSNGRPREVYSIQRYLSGQYLILCSESGLYSLDEVSGKLDKITGSGNLTKFIYDFFLDSNGNLWACGSSSVDKCSLSQSDSGTFEIEILTSYNAVSHANDILETSNGEIWIAAINGVFIIAPDGEIRTAPFCEHLPSRVATGIEISDDACLWIGTENGLVRYDESSDSFRIFNSLPISIFTLSSHTRLRDGSLIFGGIGGFIQFDPSNIGRIDFSPPPIITYSSSELASSVPFSKRDLELKFSVVNHLSSGDNTFLYRLNGYDKDWRLADISRSAVYTNLHPGRYTFILRSFNSDGIQCESDLVYNFRICRPWYASIPMFLLYVLVLSTILTIIVKRLIKLIKQREASRMIDQIRERDKRIDELLKENERAERAGMAENFGIDYISSDDYEFVRKVRDAVKNNINNELFGVQQLADCLQISRSSLHAKLKGILGVSALYFIKYVRFDYAGKLLKEGQYSVLDVSQMAGFSTQAYFATAFKNFTGMSPSEFKECTNSKIR